MDFESKKQRLSRERDLALRQYRGDIARARTALEYAKIDLKHG